MKSTRNRFIKYFLAFLLLQIASPSFGEPFRVAKLHIINIIQDVNFEAEAEAFCLAECLKEQRRLAGLTQEQLAAKIGTKKSYISKIENGHADVQLSTLFRIFSGLGKRISLTVL